MTPLRQPDGEGQEWRDSWPSVSARKDGPVAEIKMSMSSRLSGRRLGRRARSGK